MKIAFCLAALTLVARSGDPPFPPVWVNYNAVVSTDVDFADLKAHGVGLVNVKPSTPESTRKALLDARRFGMKYGISFPDITEDAARVRAEGLEPSYALMIGGAYQGKAIDRHLFSVSTGPNDLLIEPPVYNPDLPYTKGSGGTGKPKQAEPIAHYWPEMPAPVRAEIILPLAAYDGKQHLSIITAKITPALPDTKPDHDTAAGLRDVSEIRERKLYHLRFILPDVPGALYDKVGIAVYWPYHGTTQYWLFGKGTVSAVAPSTREALARAVHKTLSQWTEANDGKFPSDVVKVARFGDECFYLTGHTHLSSNAISAPLWDYSDVAVKEFHTAAGPIEYPRTWGFPEVYGPDAYAWWMYNLHKHTAALAAVVREQVRKDAPGLLVFRNTTRGGVFSLGNNRDGSGPELLTRELDIVHLDPYPLSGSGYSDTIPRDMSYYAGLARRYDKPLVPWLQAHTYTMGKEVLQHPTPADIDRMAREHLQQGIDAAVWLGYCPDCTFPKVAPESWARAVEFHKQLRQPARPKPQPELAVLRSYREWALTTMSDGLLRNPADWKLQQLLEVWAVQNGKPYDVFELSPRMSEQERQKLARDLKKYKYVAGTEPWPGAWVIPGSKPGETVSPSTAIAVQEDFEAQLKQRGWLTAPQGDK